MYPQQQLEKALLVYMYTVCFSKAGLNQNVGCHQLHNAHYGLLICQCRNVGPWLNPCKTIGWLNIVKWCREVVLILMISLLDSGESTIYVQMGIANHCAFLHI